MNKSRSYDKSFNNFQELYLKKLKPQLSSLSLIADECELGTITYRRIGELKQMVHKFAGSGATFGFPDISEQASKMEALIDRYLSEKSSDKQKDLNDIRTLLRRLVKTASKLTMPTSSESKPEIEPDAEREAESSSSPQLSAHILVADDDKILQNFLSKALTDQGHKCTCVDNGRQALSFLKQNRPNLIILDNDMPEMNGIEALKNIKDDKNLKAIPIVMLTRNVDDKTIISTMASGIQEYLTKPFEMGNLVKTINSILNHKQQAS